MIKKPNIFYKYRSVENLDWIREIVLDNKLHFATPASFNDPFEFYSYINQPTFTDFRSYVSHHECKLEEYKLMNNIQLKSVFKNTIIKMYRAAYNETMNAMKQTVGVLCLSTNPFSINLWSHYGDDHKGVCFGFLNSNDSIFNSAEKVQYVNQPVRINYFSDIINTQFGLFDKIVAHKYGGAWEIEAEYRILKTAFGLYDFPKKNLNCVYLGCKFKNDEFLAILKEHLPNLNVIKLKIHDTEFKLSVGYNIKAKQLEF